MLELVKNGEKLGKFGCSECITGHRTSECEHGTRIVFEIPKPGRPKKCSHDENEECFDACSDDEDREFTIKYIVPHTINGVEYMVRVGVHAEFKRSLMRKRAAKGKRKRCDNEDEIPPSGTSEATLSRPKKKLNTGRKESSCCNPAIGLGQAGINDDLCHSRASNGDSTSPAHRSDCPCPDEDCNCIGCPTHPTNEGTVQQAINWYEYQTQTDQQPFDENKFREYFNDYDFSYSVDSVETFNKEDLIFESIDMPVFDPVAAPVAASTFMPVDATVTAPVAATAAAPAAAPHYWNLYNFSQQQIAVPNQQSGLNGCAPNCLCSHCVDLYGPLETRFVDPSTILKWN